MARELHPDVCPSSKKKESTRRFCKGNTLGLCRHMTKIARYRELTIVYLSASTVEFCLQQLFIQRFLMAMEMMNDLKVAKNGSKYFMQNKPRTKNYKQAGYV